MGGQILEVIETGGEMASARPRRISRNELARNNGRDGTPAWIAFRGNVYDVSRSFLWQRGKHQVFHLAGMDLTGEIADAPHGPEMLERVILLGVLEDEPRVPV